MTSQSTSHISIIIPTLNEEKLLGGLLSSLESFDGLEIIVADGGSEDLTLNIARAFPRVRIVQSLAGRGLQQNAGARIASQPILLFLHCDTGLPEDFSMQVNTVLQQPDTAAGAFPLHIDAQGLRYRLVEWGANVRTRLLDRPYGDQAIFMKKHVFDQAGGYPEQPFLEDLELIRRVKRIGKIGIATGRVTTSARRWKHLGVLRTTLINQCILLGHICGIDAAKLGRFYHDVLDVKRTP